MTSPYSDSVATSTVNTKAIVKILSTYSGENDSFINWKQRVYMIKDTYHLGECSTKSLIHQQLRGKALDWFHANPNNISLSVAELFEKLRQRLDHRPNRLVDSVTNVLGLDLKTTDVLQKLYVDEQKVKSNNRYPDNMEMVIMLKYEQPIIFKPRRLAFADKEKLCSILDELLKDSIIHPSNSSYASPIVLVRKKTGELLLGVDYRELNKITIKDHFPSPLIDNHLDQLKHKKLFSKLDLKNGFYHINP
ncbi:Transposon Ty3-I Gag-Pol polyprotein [Anthophora retusa]